MTHFFEGSCHCGALGWTYRTALAPGAWTVRSCQCSFCRRHGARCTSDPAGEVEFRAEPIDALLKYRFALGTADFLLCKICGGYLGAMIETDAGAFATLNLNLLTTPLEALPEALPISYDAETESERIARRTSKWTPVSRTPK